MRLRTIGLAAALSASIVGTSGAVVRSKNREDRVVNANESTAPRSHRSVRWSRKDQFAPIGLPGWTGMIDDVTGVPVRMWGAGVAAPGAMQDPAAAEQAARAFISQHLALLAPGATMADLTLVANQLSPEGDVRSIGFEQRIGGVRVLGGTVSVSFKNDRVVMVGSTALPNVSIAATPRAIDLPALEAGARAWLAVDGHDVTVRSVPVERVIVPSVRPANAGGITYRLADQLSVQAARLGDGRWTVWMDAVTGVPIARQSELMFATGRVLFDAPDRSPSYGTRGGKVVGNVEHMVDNVSTMANADGVLTWASGAVTVAPHLSGTYIKVTSVLGGALSDSLPLTDGADVTWSHATEEFGDAQISAFVFATQAKTFARTHYNPGLAYWDEQLSVNVNEDDTCNAFSTGDDIHFFKAKAVGPGGGTTGTTGLACQNTGRIADVVYHEFGHSIHNQSIIPGVGQFDGHMSEGVADMNAAFMTKDHGMGRGFFFTTEALRDLDPDGLEKRYPDNWTGEVHDDGEIIGETYWDMRKGLIAKLGEDAGDAQARKIYYGTLQRSVDELTSYVEALVTDDDDGDLTNGTPNYCEIYSAWAAHGLADPRTTLNLSEPARDGFNVSFTAGVPLQTSCAPPSIATAKMQWRTKGGQFQTVDMTSTDSSTWAGAMPTQADGSVIQYQVTVTTSDGGKIVYPENPGIPFYEFYVGDVDQLWCASFEDGGTDWTHSATRVDRDEWEVGAPMGLGGDPRTAHGGTNVLGIDLDKDGMYRNNISTWAESPDIDLQGHTSVRLQYYRWLGVEDSAYDEAAVFANGQQVWSNSTSSPSGDEPGTASVDHEWAFHDIDLSAQAAASPTVKLKFQLTSDQGQAYGGWTVDDVCIVAAKPRTDCTVDDTCPPDDSTIADNGCCSVGAKPYSGIVLSLGALGLLLRRRRRRS
jgi:MYXO-CTERM domain-containing protein